MTCDWVQVSNTRQHISLQNGWIPMRFHCILQRFKTPYARCNKAAPEHDWISFMFHSVLFLVCFIFAYVNINLMRMAKKFQFHFLCPFFQKLAVCQHALWLIQISLFMLCFPTGSSPMKSSLAQTMTGGAIWYWCTLNLEFTFNFFRGCCRLFGYQSNYNFLQFVISFPPVTTAVEVSWSPNKENNISK